MKNTERIHINILGDVAENLGFDIEDGDIDFINDEEIADKINSMSNDELFESWCVWNGFIGWSGEIKGALMEIFDFKESD